MKNAYSPCGMQPRKLLYVLEKAQREDKWERQKGFQNNNNNNNRACSLNFREEVNIRIYKYGTVNPVKNPYLGRSYALKENIHCSLATLT